MTTTESIDIRIKTFKASSSFTPGDPFSFSIELNEDVRLPGRYNPADYIRGLGASVEGKNVLVVCPGNGGLCTAAINLGASTVVALEPRNVYLRALSGVAEFTSEVIGTTFSQRSLNEKLVESFDVVFWAEGVDDIVHPKVPFEAVLRAMAPGGLLYLELAHGHHGKLPESINSWRPSKAAFNETLADYPELQILGELAGRDQVRRIYTIKNNKTQAESVAEKAVDLDARVEEAALDYAEASSDEEKVEALDRAAEALTQKVEVMKQAVLTPEPVKPAPTPVERVAEKIKEIIPVENTPVDNLDSLYEGRTSTPKSKQKKKSKTSRKKRGKSKS